MRSTPVPADAASATGEPLLAVRGLRLGYPAPHGEQEVLRGVDLEVGRGTCLGLVGESGSGKSQLLLALLGLSPDGARLSGSVRLAGQEMLGAAPAGWRAVRGRRISLVPQDAQGALDPYVPVGAQLREALRHAPGLGRTQAQARAAELLELVQLDEPARQLRQYPHELSGGQRQRVLLAMALGSGAELLLLDEPTTALDVTVQAQVLALLREVRARTGVSLLFVTHDLALLAGIADHVAVMYAGRVVERAPAARLYASPRHPYTGGLLRSIPRADQAADVPLPTIPGQPPAPGATPRGCAFAPRCPLALAACASGPPPLRADGPTLVACHATDAAGRMQEAWP